MSRRSTKKNPFMSFLAERRQQGRRDRPGPLAPAARQQRSAMFRAAGELSASYWNEALKTLSPGKRRNSGK